MDTQDLEQTTKVSRGTVAIILVILVLAISVGTLGWMLHSAKEKITEETTIVNHINDTLKISRNEKGQLVAKISVLQTGKVGDFLKIKNLTGVNKQLQDEVSKYKGVLGTQGSVTIIKDDTRVDTTVKTIVLSTKDTVKGKNDTVKIFPQYTAKIQRGIWFSDNILATKDSITISPMFHNEYSLVIGEESDPHTGIFGSNIFNKKIPFSQVTNLNPYSNNPVLRTYSLKDRRPPKPFGFGIQGGYGGQFFKQQINTGFYLGIGLSYNFFNF